MGQAKNRGTFEERKATATPNPNKMTDTEKRDHEDRLRRERSAQREQNMSPKARSARLLLAGLAVSGLVSL